MSLTQKLKLPQQIQIITVVQEDHQLNLRKKKFLQKLVKQLPKQAKLHKRSFCAVVLK